jgi:hypothetical protein
MLYYTIAVEDRYVISLAQRSLTKAYRGWNRLTPLFPLFDSSIADLSKKLVLFFINNTHYLSEYFSERKKKKVYTNA